MTIASIHEAKTRLSELLRRVEAGEVVVIARAGKPVARLMPFAQPREPRTPGTAKGFISIGADFDDPLPDEILDAFEG